MDKRPPLILTTRSMTTRGNGGNHIHPGMAASTTTKDGGRRASSNHQDDVLWYRRQQSTNKGMAPWLADSAQQQLHLLASATVDGRHQAAARLCIPEEFLGIPQGFLEWAFEIWGIWRNLVPSFKGIKIIRSTYRMEHPKTCSLFKGNKFCLVFCLLQHEKILYSR
jgi:hypothetical protein